MVGPLLHEPGHAARGDQLGDADHRATRPRAVPAYEPAGARLGDPRLPDRGNGAGADGREVERSVRAQACLCRRLRPVRARVAGRRLLAERDRPHPVEDPAGHRLVVPVRQRGRARHRRIPQRETRPCDGSEHDDRRDRPRAGARAGRCARRDLVALGVLVQRPARPRRRRVGRPDTARAREARLGAGI